MRPKLGLEAIATTNGSLTAYRAGVKAVQSRWKPAITWIQRAYGANDHQKLPLLAFEWNGFIAFPIQSWYLLGYFMANWLFTYLQQAFGIQIIESSSAVF